MQTAPGRSQPTQPTVRGRKPCQVRVALLASLADVETQDSCVRLPARRALLGACCSALSQRALSVTQWHGGTRPLLGTQLLAALCLAGDVTLTRPLPCPALPCPALPCPALPCPAPGCLGNPPAPANAAFSCGVASPPGSVCAATCAPGFAGSPSATCQINKSDGCGKWTTVTGSCRRGAPPSGKPTSRPVLGSVESFKLEVLAKHDAHWRLQLGSRLTEAAAASRPTCNHTSCLRQVIAGSTAGSSASL